MSFANPWGLLGLLSLPAILFFHWYQRRFPRMAVAGLHLWGAKVDSRDAGPKRERLPITASLLLELLLALLLSLILSRPRVDATEKAEHLVIVLDDSASMSATPAGETVPRTAAIEMIEQRIEALPKNSVVTMLLTGPVVSTLAGPEARPDEALAALTNWQPRKPRHDFAPAWDQASQIAGETGRLLFLTDRVPTDKDGIPEVPMPNRMEIVSVGQSAGNIGFTRARWTLLPLYEQGSRRVAGIVGRVFVWVQNFGASRDAVKVVAKSQAGVTVFEKTQSLRPGEGAALRFAVPGGTGQLEISATARQDALSLDNKIVLLEPKLRTVNVAVTLKPMSPARFQVKKALRSIPGVDFTKAETADLVVAPSWPLPESRENLWWLGVGPPNPPSEKAAKAEAETEEKQTEFANDSPYIIDRSHPLMRGIQLDGVRWRGAKPFDLAVRPLIVREGRVLLGQLKGTDTTAFVLNVDLKQSSLVEAPDWPILFQDLIDLRRRALPGLRDWNYRSGEPVTFRLPPEAAGGEGPLKLTRGEETRNIARTELVRFPAPVSPGIYELRDGEKSLGRIAIAFGDSRESDLSRLEPGRYEPTDASADTGFFIDKPLSPLVISLIVLALAALFFDWFVLKPKRRT